MLNIYFGDMPEAVYNTSVYFNYTYEDEWLTSDFAKEAVSYTHLTLPTTERV